MAKPYRELTSTLPKNIFKPHPLRMCVIVLHFAFAIGLISAGLYLPLHWGVKVLFGLILGHITGVNGLLAHELLHGAIIRNKFWQNRFGFFLLFPFFISPAFWRFWHNNLHHSHTQKIIKDPDAYPTYRIFKHSRFSQWMFPVTPGSGTLRSYFYFFYWFSINVFLAQFYFRFRNKVYEKLDHKLVNMELAAQFLLHVGLLYLAGPANWFWMILTPFIIQNYIIFSYISTNHNLSPLTKENDPLENSLTVTNHPFLERLHLNFGYHVEHHLYPTMNPIHAKTVHKALIRDHSDRYHYMPKWNAIVALYKTARIYKNAHTLFNPRSGDTFDTIPPKRSSKNGDDNKASKNNDDGTLDSQNATPQTFAPASETPPTESSQPQQL